MLGYAFTSGGEPVVATDAVLCLPDGRRLGWDEIEHASWQDGRLVVQENGAHGGSHRVDLPEPGRLTDVVYDRVTATIVLSEHTALRGDQGVRVVARRAPGSSELSWQLRFDDGLDADDPQLHREAERFLTEIRATYL